MHEPARVKQSRTQAQRRDEAERRILQAAVRLIVEKGYDRFSLAEVGEAAGYSRGLPGHYFGGKDGLLAEAAKFLVERYRVSVADTLKIEPGLPRLSERLRRYAKQVGSSGNRALAIIIAEGRFHVTLKRAIVDLNRRSREAWEAEIRLGIEAGNIRADISAEDQALVIHSFVRGLTSLVDLDPGFNAETAGEAFLATFSIAVSPLSKT